MPIEDRLTEIMPDIERFVALMYDRTSTRLTVNEARKDLFTKMAQFFHQTAGLSCKVDFEQC